ncbi:hypothetical protein [Mesorhizobium sp.]|uniref:hypothetical protein n=1 Tax=Mesorhizobium sp. TaxID=1871066 RepID=UPI0025BCBBCE|nr:hypothetical protein [Mesorhizobium sp.]
MVINEGTTGVAEFSCPKAIPCLAQRLEFLSDLQAHPVFVDLREGLFRFIALLVAAIFVYRGVNNVIVDPGRLNVLLLTISETLTFIWLLLARRPIVRDWSPFTVFISLTAGFGSGFVSLQEGAAIIPLSIAAPLQLLALWLVIWGKMSLGRSFAILPANRGVVTGGGLPLRAAADGRISPLSRAGSLQALSRHFLRSRRPPAGTFLEFRATLTI